MSAQNESILADITDEDVIPSENDYKEDSSLFDAMWAPSLDGKDDNDNDDKISDSCNQFEIPLKTSDIKIAFKKVDLFDCKRYHR